MGTLNSLRKSGGGQPHSKTLARFRARLVPRGFGVRLSSAAFFLGTLERAWFFSPITPSLKPCSLFVTYTPPKQPLANRLSLSSFSLQRRTKAIGICWRRRFRLSSRRNRIIAQ